MKFTPGYWKCRDGSKAFVSEVAEGKLWGRVFERGRWKSERWEIDGSYVGDGTKCNGDLVASWKEEPERVEGWVATYRPALGGTRIGGIWNTRNQCLHSFLNEEGVPSPAAALRTRLAMY